MARLVAVSNRVGPVRGAARAGGLAVGLVEALKESGGLWFGWSGKIATTGEPRVETESVGGLGVATLDLTRAEYEDYYNGFANRCIWPLFHYRSDLTDYDRRYYDSYLRVNRRFAHVLVPMLRPDDLVWIHDYHLFAMAEEMRAMGVRQRIGFFLHIPFPPRELLATLPHHDRLVQAMFSYDVVGFQTEDDRRRFEEYVLCEAGGRAQGDRLRAFGRSLRAGVYPIGIDVDQFHSFTATPDGEREYRRLRESLRGRDLIIGVDRLDYSKGIRRRFLAYEELLATYPETRGRVEFLQVAPVSRGEVKAYRDFRLQLEQIAGRINGRFGEYDWTPLRYINRAIPRRSLAGLYRASRIGLVTPLRDGMNLVAKEFVAAQDADDPGVLVLSRFAGAAARMKQAMLVNPYDLSEVAEALQTARHMPLAERRKRHAALLKGLRDYDVARWRREFLRTLSGVRRARRSGRA